MKAAASRRDQAARIMERIGALCREPVEGDVWPRIEERLVAAAPRSRERSGQRPLASGRRMLLLLAPVGVAAGASILWHWTPPQGPHPSQEAALARNPVGSPEAQPAYATVLGPGVLFADGRGNAEPLRVGTAVPFGVSLRAEGSDARIVIGDRVDVRIDGGTEILLEGPSKPEDRLVLYAGRIDVDVRSPIRPCVIRVQDQDVEMRSGAATFGVLAAPQRRWAAAVHSGELTASVSKRAILAVAGDLVGGGTGVDAAVRRLSERFEPNVRAERRDGRWVVTGLTDFLADVRADGAPLSTDREGRFDHAPSVSARRVRLTAVDAAGRRWQTDVSLAVPRGGARGGPEPVPLPDTGPLRPRSDAVPPSPPNPAPVEPALGAQDDRPIQAWPPSWGSGN